MTQLKCLACGGTTNVDVPVATRAAHVCPPGTETPRNENVHPNLFFSEGKPMRRLPPREGRASWEPWGNGPQIVAVGKGVGVVTEESV